MCALCDPDFNRSMASRTYATREEHDGWLFPHGRHGYPGAVAEEIEAARARCPWCPTFVLPPGLLPDADA